MFCLEKDDGFEILAKIIGKTGETEINFRFSGFRF